jgi:hypothetical protein
VLPAIVPIGQFLIRAGRVVVALSHASVYPNGCLLDVRASARGHDAAVDVFERSMHPFEWAGARGHDAAPDVFEDTMFTAQFGTGTTAVTYDKRSPDWPPGGKPALVLMQYGLQGDFRVDNEDDRKADCTLRLWLCPLPPPEPGTLSIVWPGLGPGLASCPLDGRAIVAAAAQAQPYWR